MDLAQIEKMENLIAKGREFRNCLSFEIRSAGENGAEKYVEGVACVFNRETVMYEYDGVEYKEMVDAAAFASADMTDVVFQYNHGGKVMARTRNKTLELSLQPDGLHIRARLDGTAEGRKMYEEIDGGYIDRMSYCYSLADNGAEYDVSRHLRTIKRIKKLWDVSPVDFPAYDATSVSTRCLLDAEKEAIALIRATEERKKRLGLLIEI